MTLQKLTTEMQTHCHEGFSESEVYIGVLDAVFKIDKIQPYEKPNGEKFFVIKTKPITEGK